MVKRVGYRLGIPWMGVRIPKMIDIFFSFYSSLLFSLLFKELTLNMFVSVLYLNKKKYEGGGVGYVLTVSVPIYRFGVSLHASGSCCLQTAHVSCCF